MTSEIWKTPIWQTKLPNFSIQGKKKKKKQEHSRASPKDSS